MIEAVNKSQKQNILFLATIILMAGILFMGNILVKNTSDIINVMCIAVFPFLNVSGIMALICFFVPVHTGITGMYVFGYAVLIIILKEKKIELKTLVFFVIILALEILLSLFAPKFKIMELLPYLCALFIFIFGIYNKKSINYRQCCYSYIFGTMLLMLCVFITSMNTYGIEELFSGNFRIGINDEILNSMSGISFISDNPNSLGCYSANAIILALFLLADKGKASKILIIISLIINIFVGALTISRTWLAVTALGIILYVLLGAKSKNRILILLVIALILAVVVGFLNANTNIIKAFMARLEGIGFEENDRTQINNMYMNWMLNNPIHLIFGTGATFYQSICNLGIAVHSGPMHVFVAYGVIGVVYFIILLLTPIVNYFKRHRFKITKIIPIIVAVAFTITGHFLNPYYLMFPFMVAIFYMRMEDVEGKQ